MMHRPKFLSDIMILQFRLFPRLDKIICCRSSRLDGTHFCLTNRFTIPLQKLFTPTRKSIGISLVGGFQVARRKSRGGGDVSICEKYSTICASRLNQSRSIFCGVMVRFGLIVKLMPKPRRVRVPDEIRAFSVG